MVCGGARGSSCTGIVIRLDRCKCCGFCSTTPAVLLGMVVTIVCVVQLIVVTFLFNFLPGFQKKKSQNLLLETGKATTK